MSMIKEDSFQSQMKSSNNWPITQVKDEQNIIYYIILCQPFLNFLLFITL